MQQQIRTFLYSQLHTVSHWMRYCQGVIIRRVKVSRISSQLAGVKVYYGCGDIAQRGYINIVVRYTNAVDLVGDLSWCSKNFYGVCSEVYLSHVFEHYSYPGREKRRKKDSVLYALSCVYRMLHKLV